MESARDFPLFPLRLVALPSELVPLHIFEERYKALVAHCEAQGSEFGIVCVGEGGLRPIGCACEIAEVLERFPDGRLNLVARGMRAFRLVEQTEDRPYPAGTVEFLGDEDEEPDAGLLAEAHDTYADLIRQATDGEADREEIATMGAYAMAATVEFGLDAKQELLGLRSENARLTLLLQLFRAAVRRLGYIERVQERAASNGRVRFEAGP